MGMTSRLDDEGVREAVADLYARGVSRKEMLEALPCTHKDTVSVWCRDEQVQVLVEKKIRERANSITRRVDSVIEGRLSQAKDIDTKTLLDIRKTFVGSTINVKSDADKSRMIEELWLAADQDPALAEALTKLFNAPDGV